MTQSIIKPSPFHDGTYKRRAPRLVATVVIPLSKEEAQAVRKGRRGCSCEAADLTALGERCMGIAREVGAKSWSIVPIVGSQVGVPKVYVKFHSWKEMGMCNFATPIGKSRYWWDTRPLPHWIAPDDKNAEVDKDGHFDLEA